MWKWLNGCSESAWLCLYRRIRTKTQQVAFLSLRSLGFMILLFLGILHSFIFMADVHQSAANIKPLIAEMNPTDLTMQHFAEVVSQRTTFAQAALHIKHHTSEGTNTFSWRWSCTDSQCRHSTWTLKWHRARSFTWLQIALFINLIMRHGRPLKNQTWGKKSDMWIEGHRFQIHWQREWNWRHKSGFIGDFFVQMRENRGFYRYLTKYTDSASFYDCFCNFALQLDCWDFKSQISDPS